jgi:putative transposase
MADLFLLSRVPIQMRRIERYFPLSHGVAHVDDRRIVSAIVFVIRYGCAGARPARIWPAQDNLQSVRSLEPPGCVQQDFRRTGAQGRQPERIMIDATHLKADRTAASLLKKGRFPDVSDAPKAA